MKIVGVTKCPTGIAHTYMAAERLEKTAAKLGYEIKGGNTGGHREQRINLPEKKSQERTM